jgi:integrase
VASRPHIPLLREDNVRTGFFEAHHYGAQPPAGRASARRDIRLRHGLADRLGSPAARMAPGDLDGGEVRLDAGTTKNGEGRVFPFTAELRTLLKAQHAEHERLKKAGQMESWVFFRMVAERRRGPKKPQPILSLGKARKSACIKAGCPGRIPHDLRRTAVRNLVRASVPESFSMAPTGHKTPSVFARYNITSPGDLREAVRKLDLAAGSLPTPASAAGSRR